MENKKVFISYSHESLSDFREFIYYDLKENLNCKIFEHTHSVSSKWSYELEDVLLKSDLVIAILDNANSNVYYEIGVAQGMGKPILLIVQNEEDIPSNLLNHKCLYWRNRNKEKLIYEIEQTLSDIKPTEKKTHHDFSYFFDNKSLNIDILNKIDSVEFEKVICDVFNKFGFEPKLNNSDYDKGYDIILNNYKKQKALVECKRYDYNKKVSIETVLRLLELLVYYNINHGFIITTSKFTESALEFVKELKDKKIELWDLEKLRNEFIHTK